MKAALAQATSIKQVPDDLTPDLESAPNDFGDDKGCEVSGSTTTSPPCVYGDPNGAKTVVLLGDSHAGMWFPALELAAKRAHWKLVELVRPACPAPEITFWDQENNRPNTTCDTWRANAIARINQAKPDVVVVTSASPGQQTTARRAATGDEWYAGLKQTLAKMTIPGRRVVLGDIPLLDQPGPDCLAAHENNVQACSTRLSDAVSEVLVGPEQQAAKDTGAQYIGVEPWLCSDVCTPIVRNIEVYKDRYHITATYARFLSGSLQDALAMH